MKAIKNKIKENKNFIILYNHQLLYWHTVEPKRHLSTTATIFGRQSIL